MDYFTIHDKKTNKFIRYGIFLENSDTVAIIEDHYRPSEEDITFILYKIQVFRADYTWCSNHKLYIGFSTENFTPELEDKCKEYGFATIKKVENNYVIDYEHTKYELRIHYGSGHRIY